MMYLEHKNGNMLRDKTESQFLSYLAKFMNTSEEQLRQTYVTVSQDADDTIVEEILKIFSEQLSKHSELTNWSNSTAVGFQEGPSYLSRSMTSAYDEWSEVNNDSVDLSGIF